MSDARSIGAIIQEAIWTLETRTKGVRESYDWLGQNGFVKI
jgi:hypothetical protein